MIVSTSWSSLWIKWIMQQYQVRGQPFGSVLQMNWLLYESDGKDWDKAEGSARLLLVQVTHYYNQAFQCLHFRYPSAKLQIATCQGPGSCSPIVSIRGKPFVLAKICVCVENDSLSQCLLRLLKYFATKIYVWYRLDF